MKKYNLIFVFFLFNLLFMSCRQSTSAPESNSFFGTWVESQWDDTIQELHRADAFDTNKYGFIIYKDGRFTEHANSGDCETPPIVYTKYAGKWTSIKEDSLHIEVAFWGGMTRYDMKIISLDSDKLRIKKTY